MDDLDNPYRRATASSYTDKPAPKRKPSAATMKIIRELDFRYPPSSQTSDTDREARLLMLGSDVADVPTHLLSQAADQWAKRSVYMPKASELIQLAHDALPSRGTKTYADWVRGRNQGLQDIGSPSRWVLDGGNLGQGGTGMHLETLVEERPYIPLSQKEIDNLPPSLINIGLRSGYIAKRGSGYVAT